MRLSLECLANFHNKRYSHKIGTQLFAKACLALLKMRCNPHFELIPLVQEAPKLFCDSSAKDLRVKMFELGLNGEGIFPPEYSDAAQKFVRETYRVIELLDYKERLGAITLESLQFRLTLIQEKIEQLNQQITSTCSASTPL